MIKPIFKIDYQLKHDEHGRQMLFVASYQNNRKIDVRFVGNIKNILAKNKMYKEAIDKAIEYIENNLKSFLYSDEYKTLLNILKEG